MGSLVELLITNIKADQAVFPAFPGELRTDITWQGDVKDRVERELAAIQKVADAFETVGALHERGFPHPALDLQAGLVEIDADDFDGAIVAFRKSIEGLKKAIESGVTIRESAGKTAVYLDHLKKSFHMLSASGLHTATVGLRDEALFAREITVATARFFVATATPPSKT